MEIKKRTIIRFGYLRQSYLFMSHWSHPIIPNVPIGGDQWDVLMEIFECKYSCRDMSDDSTFLCRFMQNNPNYKKTIT